jgi:hypothetical protein
MATSAAQGKDKSGGKKVSGTDSPPQAPTSSDTACWDAAGALQVHACKPHAPQVANHHHYPLITSPNLLSEWNAPSDTQRGQLLPG